MITGGRKLFGIWAVQKNNFIWNIILYAIIAASLDSCSFAASPLGNPGTAFKYRLESLENRPEEAIKNGAIVINAEFRLGSVVKIQNKRLSVVEIWFERQNGKKYSALLLIDSWPNKSRMPDVARYLWHEPDWPDYLEYQNEATGKPELPRFSIWEFGWPQAIDGKYPASLQSPPEKIYLHGWPFVFVSKSKSNVAIPKTTIIKLNPDVIIGLTGTHRDRHGRHMDALGVKEYDFIDPPDEEDWRKDIEAGINLFQGNRQPRWIWRTNCYISQMYMMPDDWPTNIYRSNYWGRSFLSDEPAVYNYAYFNSLEDAADKVTPEIAAKALEKLTMDNLNRLDNNYGNRILGVFVDKVFGKGNLDIVERKFPVWEAVWQTSWYHLALKAARVVL